MGSSRNKTLGLLMSSTPIETRFRSPPLTPRARSSPIMVCRVLARPKSVTTPMTRAALRVGGREEPSAKCAANVKVSSTVKCPKSKSSCVTWVAMVAMVDGWVMVSQRLQWRRYIRRYYVQRRRSS